MRLIGILSAILRLFVKGVVAAVKIVYRLLKALRIRALTLYLCVCGILQLVFGLFSMTEFMMIYFWFGFIVCLMISLIGWLFALRAQRLRRSEARKRKKADQEEKKRILRERMEDKQRSVKQQTYPVYYAVAGHEDYIFAEYTDRYELYRKENGRLVYLRTDFKQE